MGITKGNKMYKTLEQEKNYNPLTPETIKSQELCDAMKIRISEIREGERITYYSGIEPWAMVKGAISAYALRRFLNACMPKFRHDLLLTIPEKNLIFLCQKQGRGFDYMVVGK